MKIVIRYFFRALVFPFFAVIALMGLVRWWLQFMFNYIRFGGESTAYSENPKTIADVYAEIQKLIKEK